MLWSSIVLGDVFFVFSFRNVLKHVMCQMNDDE